MRKAYLSGLLASLLFLVLLVLVGPVLGKPEPNPYLLALEEAFVKIASDATPAVVSITAKGVINEDSTSRNDPFHDWPQPQPREIQPWVNGSGFIFKKDGHILTSNHIVNGAEKIEVRLYDNRELTARIVGSDPGTDVAVLKIDEKGDFPALPIGDSDKIKVGQWAIAIGNPYQLDFTLTVGIISAKGRANLVRSPENLIRYEDFIQTDAAINKGNSGGPLLNLKGEVIGINSMIRASSPFDSGNIGIGFAVPINMAMTVATQLIAKGRVVRGWLGIRMKTITEIEQKEIKLADLHGVKVEGLINDGPAQKAGLQAKDIILEFDGKTVKDPKNLQWMVANTDVGKNVKLKIYREQAEKILTVKIDEMPAEYTTISRPTSKTSDEPPPPSLRDRIPQRREQR